MTLAFARRPNRLKGTILSPFVRSWNPSERRVMITFDDGPHPVHTVAAVDRLRAYDAVGAFFLVGKRIAMAPHLPSRIATAGHLIGNHGFEHRHVHWWETAFPIADVDRCQELLPRATLFRPPFGRLTPALWWAARRHGLTPVNWSLDSGDWRCREAGQVSACAVELLANVQPRDILLFHDDRQWIGPILDIVLPGLKDRGLL